ncbi:fucose permease [Isoptericola sp. CG 20/1183]|uniref:Fucose permease n=1 Tax=Isoptericola halotolerans TaxID=300560 RepID=A0ABX5EHL7_9MICO|nr:MULTISPECIES: MFS transporter [Isoptericola]MCK0116754.1 MFS transporter [Isoptericola sp. S6320L]PRZ02930.1 fucose permease [Isoptericola sp. CG 20/1183]PRZ09927.1 fucose permease [Isoptericola halotolerans]
MSTDTTPGRPGRPDLVARRARAAVAALFLTNGALFANLLPRYPEIKAALDLSNTVYGLAVIAFPAGAIVSGFATAAAVRRFGSARIAAVGTVLTAVGVLCAGLAPALGLFVAALFAAGASDAFTDVGQNAHGLRVQRRYGRSIFNSFHALWSVGSVVGGAMSAVAIALDVPLGIHLAVSGAIFSAVALVALRYCLPGLDEQERAAGGRTGDRPADGGAPAAGPRGRTIFLLVAFVVVAISGTVVEEATNSWAAVYLSGSLDTTGAVAATAFIAFMAAEFVGRATGDRFVDRFGQRAVARAGGLLVAVAMGLALAFPSVPGTVVGFAVAGFGVATVIPAAMHAADELPGLRAGTGLMVVTWLMRLGFLLTPPFVGLVSDATTLQVGLLVVPAAGIAIVLAGSLLQGRRTTPRIDL